MKNLTVVKRGDEALNASSLYFLRSVKHFIATILYSALNASSPLRKIIVKRLIAVTFLKRFHAERFIAERFIAVAF